MKTRVTDHSRRGFLRGALFTREGRKQHARVGRRLGIFPPGLESVIKQDHCEQCDHPCIEQCEQDIIKLHSEDHVLSGQPYLDFSSNGCTFCGDCAKACPVAESRLSTNTVLGQVSLDQGTCLAWNQVFCMSCIGACVRKVFSFDHRRQLLLDQNSCNGCGMCIRICPVGSLSVTGSNEESY